MPWYLRKSLSRGPFRLNLSKSGLGASLGVKGLRIGVGPKGTYLAGGRRGLYYRQYFNAGRPYAASGAPVPTSRPVPATLPGPSEPEQNLEFAAIPASDDQVAAEINGRLRAFRWSRLLIIVAIVLGLCAFVKSLTIVSLLASAGFIAWSIAQSKREAALRCIEFNYELEEQSAHLYDTCVRSFQAAAGCSAIWRVTTQVMSRDTKYTAGAGATVNRALTKITFSDQRISSNLPTVWIWAAGGGLCLLPDRMLFFGPAGVSSLSHAAVHVTASNVDFRESGPIPADSTNVGTTWQYVNKKGGPDRRFANNRQLLIQRYSDLNFSHPNLSFHLEFSKMGSAQIILRAFESMAAVSRQTAQRTSQTVIPEATT